jgi:hypothetical protein
MAPFKVVGMSIKREGSESSSKQHCTLCKKFKHDDAYYFNNLDNSDIRLPKTKANGLVAINEV